MGVFKIKALKNWGAIVKGMEVEVVKKNTTAKPLQNEIEKAFEQKYNINAPSGVYSNASSF
jgi:hypothetical protein